jgi:hypothetical protein
MKKTILFLIMLSFSTVYAQKIGELAEEKPPEEFPPNSWGMDILIGEGGFGLGAFYRHSFTDKVTGFVDFSISESKDDREFEYIDMFGQPFVIGKKNRVFFLPLNAGIQYRLFAKELTANLRPYINAGIGPNFIISTPYSEEFFNAFGYASMKYAIGGYIGIGANFGLSKSNLVGLNVRYYYAKILGDGVENMANSFRSTISSMYVTLNIGIMY